MIKLIVSDMDGTLLAHDSSISKEILKQLGMLKVKECNLQLLPGVIIQALRGY